MAMLRRPSNLLGVLLCLGGALFAAAPAGPWLDVPFVPQEKDGCGAASAAMVIEYWLKQESKPAVAGMEAHEIQRTLYSRDAHGIRASDLERYLQQQGFRTFAFQGTWDDLQHHLEKGRPLIAALQPGSVAKPESAGLHYVVVVGLDGAPASKQAAVLLNDPAQRKLLRQDWRVFKRQWSGTGNWLLLAVPQRQSR